MEVDINAKIDKEKTETLVIYAKTLELFVFSGGVRCDLSTDEENFPPLIAYLEKKPYLKELKKGGLVIQFQCGEIPVNISKRNERLGKYFDGRTQDALEHPDKIDSAVKVYAADLRGMEEKKFIKGTNDDLQKYGISIK
jgi:hypothetical protein